MTVDPATLAALARVQEARERHDRQISQLLDDLGLSNVVAHVDGTLYTEGGQQIAQGLVALDGGTVT